MSIAVTSRNKAVASVGSPVARAGRAPGSPRLPARVFYGRSFRSGGFLVVVGPEGDPGSIVDSNHGYCVACAGRTPSRRDVRNHRMRRQPLAEHPVALALRRGIRAVRSDVPLAIASALTVIGTIFNTFSLVMFTFSSNMHLAWVYAALGMSFWILAAGCWFFFLADPLPRHSRRR